MDPVFVNRSLPKSELYRDLYPQMEALLHGESDLIANLGNFCAVLKDTFHWWWVGFYLVKEGELVLGPFQGPVACTRILPGKGVCGKALITREIQIVPDVTQFPGHIACSAESKSELVIPLMNRQGLVYGVLDIDSEHINHFDSIDAENLTRMLGLIPITDYNS